MSATIAAALKKIAVAILTNPKVLKTIGGIVLGIIIIIIMPIVAIVSIFNGDVNIDMDRLNELVIENLDEEERNNLQRVDDTLLTIETEMTNAGYASRYKEAQTLYLLGLLSHASEEDFIDKLVGCFSAEQTDEQLVTAVNDAFGVNISVEDFIIMMAKYRNVNIDISDYTDPSAKNNLDLCKWAVHAADNRWGYVYGTFGEILDDTLLASKKAQYPDEVGGYTDFIEANWLGRRTADCVGLIKGYGWLNSDTLQVEYGTNGMLDVGADSMYENAVEKGTIDTIPEIPGLAVWHEGHIGVYIGNGEVVQAANTRVGVIRTKLSDTAWTHWLKVPYITYVEGQENTT